MTRARQVLIASGCESRTAGRTWYGRLRAAVAAECGGEDVDADASLSWGGDLDRGSAAVSGLALSDVAVQLETRAVPAIVPAGQRREVATTPGQQYGTAFHRVMECLAVDPGADAEAIARGFGLGAGDARQCSEQARALMASPHVRRFFDERGFVRAFNELPLVNEVGELRRIDRVVEFLDVVWVLDYKTGRYDQIAGTAVEADYREQVAEYCRSLELVYSGKPVRGALIFAGGTLVEVTN